MKNRTSETDPLRIADLQSQGGVIGVTLCPGKRGDSVFGQAWARDLATDVAAIAAWGATAVVTLIEEHEFELLGVEGLPEAVRGAGMAWHHLPITDVSAPDERFEQAWPVLWPRLKGRLSAGERVLVHCRGGLGRAGTIAALMLVECGESPATAIARVREVRPGAIETAAQERWVLQRSRSQG
jgi:ADP-ribosyl-[dinitrogen reductase] hydrolase